MFHYENPKVLYEGKRINLLSVEINHLPGKKIRREVVDHPGAVVILPLLDPQTVILIRNERYVVQQTLWECPAGTLETGESPPECARRELEEETGYSARNITFLFDCFSSPGFCNELLSIYLAEELSYVGQKLEETEKIVAEAIPIREALKMVENGVIRDGKTISALLYFCTYRCNQ